VLALATSGILLAACGSTPSASASRIECAKVAAVLSDGPDPSADPVGYAEAQILPLRQLRLSNGAITAAVDELATAYHQLFVADGSSSRHAVAIAESSVNAVCPRVAP
jgi:hypothetical protein